MLSKIIQWFKNQFDPFPKDPFLGISKSSENAPTETLDEVIEDKKVYTNTELQKLKKEELLKIATEELKIEVESKATKKILIEKILGT